MSNKDEFDGPEGLEPDLDTGLGADGENDMDFGEFEDKKQKSSLGSIWQNGTPMLKFGLVAAIILVVVALVALFGGEDQKAATSFVSPGDKTFKEAPGTKEITQTMKEAVEEKNQQRIDEAQKQGGSAIPTPIVAPKTLLDLPDDEGPGDDPLLRWKQMQEERARALREQQLQESQKPQKDPQRDAMLQNMVTGMSAQVTSILGKEKKIGLQHMNVFDMEKLKNAAASGASAEEIALAQAGYTNATQNTPAKIILPSGKIEYAQMVLEANSDIPGPVMAQIASGIFGGGKLIGTFNTQDEHLVIRFTTLVTKRGTSVPIEAYAIDPTSSLTGVATDVDHRYFDRIVLPAAAKFIEGLGSAYAQTTSSTTQNSTTTTTSSEDLSTEQEFGKAVSEAASQAAQVLDEDGKGKKILVRVRAGTAIGVLFMAPITDQDILGARAGISKNNPQGVQQGVAQQSTGQQPTGTILQQLQSGIQGQQMLQQAPAVGN